MKLLQTLATLTLSAATITALPEAVMGQNVTRTDFLVADAAGTCNPNHNSIWDGCTWSFPPTNPYTGSYQGAAVTRDRVNVRTHHSTSSGIIDNISNWRLYVLSIHSSGNGEWWARVTYYQNGRRYYGFVRADLIRWVR